MFKILKYNYILLPCFFAFISNGYAQDEDMNLSTLQHLAELGDPQAQYILAEKYRFGKNVDPNYNISKTWYQKAADQGHIKALYMMGVFYDSGLGVKKNTSEAVQWFKKAAALGNTDAQNDLGSLYRYGRSDFSKDINQSISWYKKAADQGDVLSINNLGYAYENGQGVKIDINKAKDYYERACLYDLKWGCENLDKLNNKQKALSE